MNAENAPRSTETADSRTLEWQINSGSNTAHVIDTTQAGWRTATGERKRCGPRSLCGAYPQRNADGVWFSLAVDDPGVRRALAGSKACARCDERLADSMSITARCPADNAVVEVGAGGTCPTCGDVVIPPASSTPEEA